MASERNPIPRLGLFELTVAKSYVLTGEWLWYYRKALDRLGIERPPAHLIAEIKAMKARKEAGDPDWRDGTRRPAKSTNRSG